MKDEEGNQDEEISGSNILPNHAFGIDDIWEVPIPGQQPLWLIKIRNPWGHSGWNGKFSEEDEAWDEYKELKTILGYNQSAQTEACWWMCWDDFHTNFNKLYIGKIFPPTWQQYSISDEW